MTKHRLITALMAAGGILLAAATPALASVMLSTPMGTQPDVTAQLRIQPPRIVRVGVGIPVTVAYKDFDFQPALRCSPAGPCTGSSPQVVVNGVAQGHIHVYITPVNATDADSTSFCIPPTTDAAPGTYAGNATGTCPALTVRGVYRMTAEAQSNSHVSALKATNKPQDNPTSDAVLIVVI